MPRSCALEMTSGGGGPSALAISRAGWVSATSTCWRVGGLRVFGQRRHPELEQRVLDERLVLFGDELVQVLGRAFGGHPGRHDHVDAVGTAAGVGVHPVQDGVQFGRVVEPDGAEHA
jgi:hypothetical protein